MQIKPTQSFGNTVTGANYQSNVVVSVDEIEGAEFVRAGLAVEVKPKPPVEQAKHKPTAKSEVK